jgi:AraC-like DNA-binding protein
MSFGEGLLTAAISDSASTGSVFSTLNLPAVDQFDAWRQYLSELVELSPCDGPASSFPAEAYSWDIGGLTFVHSILTNAPRRTWTHRTRSHVDHWCLVMARPYADPDNGPGDRGHCQPGRDRSVSNPMLSFRSLVRPYDGEGRDEEIFTLLLPRDVMREANRDLELAHNVEIPLVFAALLSDFLASLARRLPTMGQFERNVLADPLRDFVAACLAPRAQRMEAAEAPLMAVMIERARHVVRQNMASPEFGPDRLCRLLAVSRSKLYRIFETSGGVASFIQRERLQEAHRILSDASELCSINVVANAVGYIDHSTFSRAFRREFGLSPSETREMALARRAPHLPPAAEMAAAITHHA